MVNYSAEILSFKLATVSKKDDFKSPEDYLIRKGRKRDFEAARPSLIHKIPAIACSSSASAAASSSTACAASCSSSGPSSAATTDGEALHGAGGPGYHNVASPTGMRVRPSPGPTSSPAPGGLIEGHSDEVTTPVTSPSLAR